MKKMYAFTAAALAATVIAGCGTTLAPTAAAPSASGTYYCHEESLSSNATAHTCNWSQNVRDVCDGSLPPSTIAAADTTGAPQRTQRCNTGRWVVAVAKK